MFSATSHLDWGALASFLGVGTVICGGILKLVVDVARLSDKVKDNTAEAVELRKELRRVNRRLGSVAATGLVMTMKITHMQDHLEEETGYRAPQEIGIAETKEIGDWIDDD